MRELKSKCCGAPLDSICGDEGTSHYRCSNCKVACDGKYYYVHTGDQPMQEPGKITTNGDEFECPHCGQYFEIEMLQDRFTKAALKAMQGNKNERD